MSHRPEDLRLSGPPPSRRRRSSRLTINLATTVGATGLAGFSGATGGLTAVQEIQNWQLGLQTGQVTVDNYEPIAFANKTKLMINGLAGSDEINLNNSTTPTGLTTITVNGGDPTGSDSVTVNSLQGVFDFIEVVPQGPGRTNIFSSGPSVALTGIEHLNVVFDPTQPDVLELLGTAGNDTYEVTPGARSDEGTVTGFVPGFPGFSFVPLTYSGIRDVVEIPGASVLGGNDTTIINGTSANDVFAVDSFGFFVRTVVNEHTGIFAESANLVLRGLDGDDTFNLNSLTGYTGTVRVEGGDPVGSDVLESGR